MADSRFFASAGPLTLGALADLTQAQLSDQAKAGLAMTDVAPLQTAGKSDVSFIDNKKYAGAFEISRAGAIFAHPSLVDRAPSGAQLLITEKPYHAYAVAASAFYPRPVPAAGVAQGAHVAEGATVAANASVEPGAVIGAGVRIGERVRVGANTVVGAGVEIGDGADIGANVTLQCCLIGERVIVHPGVRIGQDGFGFAPDQAGHLKVPQLGRVLVGHDVEIGANTAIDRGTGPDTAIGAGSKIDNLVQLAHNVKIGRGCIIVSQVGISGSTEVQDFVMIGGQAGLTGHLTIGPGARIAAQSGVMRDVPPGATIGGAPARAMHDWLRETAVLSRLARRKANG